MNKRAKDVQKSLLKSEKQIIKELEESYQKALNDINQKITELLARTDVQNLQSIIYQVEYQKAIKSQISAFIDVLHSNNFDNISRYLTECYQDNWIGTLFDFQGQGVPLLIAIDQEQVLKAIVINSKLSKKLYDALGIDIEELKKNIQSEISRGISQNYSFEKIAQNLKSVAQVSYNNSLRIAKTEGHRIGQEATYDCQVEAQKRGCQVMKEWDSTLDAKTRPTHQMLDGQMVEVDKPFTIEGNEAMYPGGFGIASEDINCRCILLQRAKWALSDDEFTKMNGETKELQHFENINDYEKFKQEFWGWNK